jgi:predicted ester cyclase
LLRRVLLSKRQPVLGSWTTDWTYEFSNLQQPQATEMGVRLDFKQKKKGFMGVGNSMGKGIIFSSNIIAKTINSKLAKAYDDYIHI